MLPKAKSGNLNLFLRILPFFPCFSLFSPVFYKEKRAKCAEKGLDYQRFCLTIGARGGAIWELRNCVANTFGRPLRPNQILRARSIPALNLVLAHCLFRSQSREKIMAMAMFKRKFARTIPDNLRAPHIKMWGFEAKRARKFTQTSPRTLPFFFHYHAFFFPDKLNLSFTVVLQKRAMKAGDLVVKFLR